MHKALNYLIKTNDLQKTKRYGNYPNFSESTSEHTFKVILIVDYFYKELELSLDYEKCIQLAIYHDFGEMDLDKDVDIKENTDKNISNHKEIYESEKITELSNHYSLIKVYYKEYKEKETPEACFVNACDKLEGMIHPMNIGKPIMNHELFANYADKAVLAYPKLMPFYREIKKHLRELYNQWNFEWKEEYESVFTSEK